MLCLFGLVASGVWVGKVPTVITLMLVCTVYTKFAVTVVYVEFSTWGGGGVATTWMAGSMQKLPGKLGYPVMPEVYGLL